MKRTPGIPNPLARTWRPATQAVRGGTMRSEWGETSEAIFMNSGYCYDNAEEVAARFRGDAPGMVYSRLQNPTVAMLEARIALMEGAEACRCMSSGMAAMHAALLCQLSQGDHIVAARTMFGSNRWLTDMLLPRFGIEVTLVDAPDLAQWQAAIRSNTKLFFFETPANPTLELADIAGICAIAKNHGIMSVVDNAFLSSALQRPLELGADVVAYSATKLMDGQGRVLAGAVCGSAPFINDVLMPFHRNTGAAISPFDAWILLKALETLDMRAQRQSANALAVAEFLRARGIDVRYPFLEKAPDHMLALRQQRAGGPILALHLGCGVEALYEFMNALQLIDISNNIGDSRSLVTHPWSTTHYAMSEDARAEAGIGVDLLRLNVGLEDLDDVIDDLDQALKVIGR